MDKTTLNHIEKFVADNERNILRDIARLVKINSVQSAAEPDAPFGRGPAEALELGLDIAQELGLNTRNCENMIGYASVGTGERYISTITHLDVVPTGDGWSCDPFTMREKEGYIIGRGVMDDKGPSILCLYALKYLKDNNIPLNYEVRALLGINEETGMKDVEYYLENYPAPVFCFSPDASFPLCNGEKGIYQAEIISKAPIGNIASIRGGFAANAVCDKAEAWIKADKLEKADNVDVNEENGLFHLTAYGIGGHASLPEGTRSAIGILADYILENNAATAEEAAFLRLINLIHKDYSGKLVGIDADDGKFKPLTVVGGVIGIKDGRMFQSVDCRYPTNTSGGLITEKLIEAAGDIADVETLRDTVPFYMELDNPAVQVCLKAYNEVTGEKAEPFTMGGGTYARDFPNAVSFGPEHPEREQPKWAGPIHGVDEAACKNYFFEALKIYIAALIELQKIDF